MSDAVMNARQLLLVVCASLIVVLITVLSPVATAQDRQLPSRVGEIWFQDSASAEPFHRAFRDGMQALGYVEGRNVTYFTLYADAYEARLPRLFGELLARKVDVLCS